VSVIRERIEHKDAPEHISGSLRYWMGGANDVGIMDKIGKTFILRGRKRPDTTTRYNVEDNDTKRPDVTVTGGVELLPKFRSDTLCSDNEKLKQECD
jgi:hypothetical protein